jgi:hypothetical protein
MLIMKRLASRIAPVATLGAGILIGSLWIRSPHVEAQAVDTVSALAQIGMAIAPVPLNLTGKDPQMVGLGSYLVNAIGDCNGCHTGGGPPNFNYTATGNPYFNSLNLFLGSPLAPTPKVDPTVYLSGGSDFGPVGTPTGPNMYAGPDIIARNLTPDYTGTPEGGMTLQQFMQIFQVGTDFDQIHPVCTAAQLAQINAGATPPPVCIPVSSDNNVNGNLLQVMPWPTFSHLTAYDIQSIYAYLSAIPCIDNNTSPPPAGAPNELRNNCTGAMSTDRPALSSPVRKWRR